MILKDAALPSGPCIVRISTAPRGGDGDEPRAKKAKRAVASSSGHETADSEGSKDSSGSTGEVLHVPGWYDGERKRLKLMIHFSRGLELIPRATARVLLRRLPSAPAS